MTALYDLPCNRIPTITHHVGDRVTDVFDTPAGMRRYVGTVTDSGSWLFTVSWDNHPGAATYAHGHEPKTLRPAGPDDERVLGATPDRLAALLAENARLRAELGQYHARRDRAAAEHRASGTAR